MDDDEQDIEESMYPDDVYAIEAFGQDVAVVRLVRNKGGKVVGHFFGTILYLLMDGSGRIVGAHTLLGVEIGAAIAGPVGDVVSDGKTYDDIDSYLAAMKKEIQ